MTDTTHLRFNDLSADALSIDDVLARLSALLTPLDHETLALPQALHRRAAQPVYAPTNVPPHNMSAMDGYAIFDSDPKAHLPLQIVGRALAGHPYPQPLQSGQALRVTTGAPLPEGCRQVLVQEIIDADEQFITAIGEIGQPDYIRPQGGDIKFGDQLLQSGQLLDPPALAVLAACGVAEVCVFRRPRVALCSSGDELCSPGTQRKPGQIYDSNRPLLHALFTQFGADIIDLGNLPDDPKAVAKMINTDSIHADIVVSTGGVSVGEADFLRAQLEALGTLHAFRLSIKPGKPFTLAQVDQRLFFALPGNPISSFVTTCLFVLPTLRAMQGAPLALPTPWPARAQNTLEKSGPRTDFQRAQWLPPGPDGIAYCRSIGAQDSHLLSVLHRANCLARVDERSISAGEWVNCYPFSSLLAP